MSSSAILAELQAARADITALKTQVSVLQTLLTSKSTADAAGPVSGKKERKTRVKNPDAAPRAPTAWRLFADRVRSVLQTNGFTNKALGVECLQFAGTLKDEDANLESWTSDRILARRADWSPPAVPKKQAQKAAASVAGSDAAPAADDLDGDADGAASATSSEKKKRGPAKGAKWSDEKKAAAAAKRAATKAAKAGLLNDEPLGASAEEIREAAAKEKALQASLDAAIAKLPPSPFALPPTPKKATPPAAAGAGLAAAGGGAAPMVFKNVLLDGKRYLVCLENGHAYNVAKDDEGNYVKNGDKYVQDSWAGIFHRTGGKPNGGPWLDSEVKDPNASADEDDELNFDE
jgi:hypothetical protein